MAQYKIPQNVGIEDKIVGPFSLRQLIILAIGFGISYTLFAITSRLYELNALEYIIIILPGLLSLAAAVIKIHNVSFTKFILLSLEFAIKPKKRFWNHRSIAPTVNPSLLDQSKSKTKSQEPQKKSKNINLTQLSATLDSGGFSETEEIKHDDLDKVNDDDLITQAYFGHRRNEGPVHNMYWRTRDVQKKKLDILAKLPPVTPSATENNVPPVKIQTEVPQPERKEMMTQNQQTIVTTSKNLASFKNSNENLSEKIPILASEEIKAINQGKIPEWSKETKKVTPQEEKAIEVKSISNLMMKPKKNELQKESNKTKVKNNLRVTLNIPEGGFKILNTQKEILAEANSNSLSSGKETYVFEYCFPKGEYFIEFNEIKEFLKPREIKINLNDALKAVTGHYRLKKQREMRQENEGKNNFLSLKNEKNNLPKKNPSPQLGLSSQKNIKETEELKIKPENLKKELPLETSKEQTLVHPPKKINSEKSLPLKKPIDKEITTSINDLQEGKEIEFNLD